jgi:hypothetical protein
VGAAAVDAEVVAEDAAARVIRVRTGLRAAGRWTIRIFRRVVPCSWLRRALPLRAEVRMMRAEAAVADEAARQGLSLA